MSIDIDRKHWHNTVIEEWNNTEVDYPRDSLAHELFFDRAKSTPGSVAVTPEGGPELTYGALRRRVEQVAGFLAARGVGPGHVVGVALERSAEGCVAILGILASGAAYLPVDQGWPAARLQVIFQEAGCRVVLTSARRLADMSALADAHDVDDLPDAAAPSTPRMTSDDPAYVIYTSGSTGKPKGVVLPHRAITRLVCGTTFIGFRSDDVVCGTASPSFDLVVLETFGALLNGARLVLPRKETLLSHEALRRLLVEQHVSVLWLNAALLHQLAAVCPEMLASLRCLAAGGDALSPTAVRAVLERGRPQRFINAYGPTENSVLSTAHIIEQLPPHAESVPIGRPLPNAKAYVVREDGQLADVEERGELWVGGAGIALGYLNQPELTEERFVPDRFSVDGRGRLYRTGDIASWRSDGVLEFWGRSDRQVKISGFRVELREIELVLPAHPQVSDAVVDVEQTGAGQSRLLAWVTTYNCDAADDLAPRLRAFLRDRLPVFMVPQEFRVVASMPLNSNGKVDRAALRAVRTTMGTPTGARRDPKGRLEQVVADVWSDLLARHGIGRDDNFFDLGGQSLYATQVVAAISERLRIGPEHGRHLIRSLLANPTVESFAREVSALIGVLGAQPKSTTVDFARESRLDPELRFIVPPAGDPLRPQHVLLTGASGFLGVFLLDRLVRAGVAEIWCVTRASGRQQVHHRLAGRMRRYGLDYDRVRDHVVPVPGDLARPKFGLSTRAYRELARSTDLILHSGSLINFAYPYEVLRADNVDGTRTVLQLAAEDQLKPVHYVSTIGVIAGIGTVGRRYVMENDALQHAERISLGYPETKWVAEQLVRQAAERGLPVSIYRPYEITGTRDRGIWNTDTLICAWFRTIAETGLAPDCPLPLDFIPVDYTADAITHIITRERPTGQVYHITNPAYAKLSLLVDRLQHRGYPVSTVPYAQWVDAVTELTKQDPRHLMTPFMPMFNEDATDAPITVKEMYFLGTFPEFSRANLERATAGVNLELPPVDAAMIDLYLDHFIDSGFLTPPANRTCDDPSRANQLYPSDARLSAS